MKPRPHCWHCHRALPPAALVEVAVTARDGGGERALLLCKRCAEHPESTWRLRWREAAR